MSASPPHITCLFFSDVTIATFLHAAPGRALAGDLLVECTPHPALSYVLNVDTPPNYPGVAGLLGGADIGSLAHPSDRLPAPILLAAGAPVTISTLRTALALLRRPDDRLRKITLLVSFAEARSFGADLALADRYAIAWNAAAFPSADLADFARWLRTEKLLAGGTFDGFFPYTTGPVDAAHAQRVAAILDPLAARDARILSQVIAL